MQGDKVHAVLGVGPHYLQEILGGKLVQRALEMDHGIVHRHCPDHGGALGGQFPAEFPGIPMGTQVHDGLRSHSHGALYLFHLHIVVLAVPGYPQIHVDLGAQHTAHAFRVQAFVVFIRGDGHLALRHQRHQAGNLHVLLFRHDFHFLGHDTLAGGVHLCRILSHYIAPFPLVVPGRGSSPTPKKPHHFPMRLFSHCAGV